ncbi:hypothetical protein MC885_018289 [Smutsia gigantea]|nr:hypothetical protein MC885_018289 [Smutsia gigantea]
MCQEDRSTSTTAVTFSGSSLLNTQSSELGGDRDLSLCHRPRKTKITQSHRPSKLETKQGQSQKSSKAEATRSQSSSKTEAMKGQSWRPSKIKATQGPRQKPKTKATQGPRQRPRRAKAAYGWGWGPSKADGTQGRCWGLNRSSSKTFYGSSGSLSNNEVTRGQCRRPNMMTKAVQSWSQSTSTSSSKTQLTWGLRPES